jgi:hypothetical protein
MKYKQYHTVGSFLNSKEKIVETEAILYKTLAIVLLLFLWNIVRLQQVKDYIRGRSRQSKKIKTVYMFLLLLNTDRLQQVEDCAQPIFENICTTNCVNRLEITLH